MTIIVGRGRTHATQRLEINDPTVSREHCWLTDNGDGTFTLENKSQLGTFVDGRKILKTTVTADTYIKLSEKTTVKVSDLLPQAAPKPQAFMSSGQVRQPSMQQTAPQQPEFSLKHLESVWTNYDKKRLEIQESAAKRANQQRIQGILSMSGMALGLLPIPLVFRAACVVSALALSIYFFMQGHNTSSVQRQLHDLEEEFADKYKCPNPACGRPFGSQPYRVLRYTKKCSACGCNYKE